MAEHLIHGHGPNSLAQENIPFFRKQLALLFWGNRLQGQPATGVEEDKGEEEDDKRKEDMAL